MKDNSREQKQRYVFTGRVKYGEDAIKAFCNVQFAAFQGKKQLGIIILSLLMIIFGVSGKLGLAVSAIFVPLGCCMLTYINFIPRNDAEKLIKAYGGNYPTSHYAFDGAGFDIAAGAGANRIGFDNIVRLIDDDRYFYFFASPKVAYIVERASLKPSEPESFKAYCAKRVGLEWTEYFPWYSPNIAARIRCRKNTKKVPK